MSIDLILRFLVVAGAAYVLGSVPFAFIWTLVIARRDLRRLGTGNITVFNSFQNAGLLPALMTVASNAGLGFAVVFMSTLIAPDSDWAIIIALVFVTVGAMWPILLAFSGGIGTTTMGWTMMFIWWPLPFAILGVWFASLVVTRRTFTSSTVVYRTLPIILGVVTRDWRFALAGLVLSILLHLKRSSEADDGMQLGAWRRLGLNKT